MENLLTVLIALALAFGWCLLMAVFVMYLWNWLMPVIFGLKTITWLQAFGLSLLSTLLFGKVTTNSK